MTLPQSDRQISDPETLSRLHRLFRSCWQEVAAKLSPSLDSESESSLRRTIASRIMREAGQGETDELAAELFADGSPADLVERYARRLPLSVICELLGLPAADRPRFIVWANRLTRLTGMVGFLRMIAGIGPMKNFLEARLQAARVTGGEGLIAELVRVEQNGGQISGQEMVAMVFLSLGAGSETTAHLISGSVYELLRVPALRDWLTEDWSRVNLATEEFLRFVSPVEFSKPRFVRTDIERGSLQALAGA